MPVLRSAFRTISRNRFGSPKLRYTPTLMARVKVRRRRNTDIRELPSYSLTEAAYYLGIPPSTLKTWFRGYRGPTGRRHPPMLKPADGRRLLLSFYNLVEAHILEAARRRGVSTKRLRIAVEWANEMLPRPHPLLTHEFKTAGKRIFLEKLEGHHTVEASRFGQFVSLKMAPTLTKFLKSIVRGPDDLPIEIHPIRPAPAKPKPPKGSEEKQKRVYVLEGPLAINPNICSGRPVVKGTDVLASVLNHRAHASESLSDLARDYDMDSREVYKVVKYLDKVTQGPHIFS